MADDFCLHEYLFSEGLKILQISTKSFLSLFFLCDNKGHLLFIYIF
jgi:hypothetical protein